MKFPPLPQFTVESSVTAMEGYKAYQAKHPTQGHVVSTSSVSDTSDGGVKLSGHDDEKPAPVLRPDAKEFSPKTETSPIAENSTAMRASAEEFTPKQADVQMTNTTESSGKRLAAEISQEVEQARIAVVVKFALGSSQYATMALRELMKAGGVKNYTPEFSSAR